MSEEQLIPTPGVFGETGNFLLERELGRGGMGGVYMGRDKMLDRPVAVKVMLKEYGADAEFVEKFKREAQAAARLIHPNIAQIYSYGIADGMPYIAMELVAGGSLDQLMKNAGASIDIPRVMKICEQVAQALRCAADQGLVHGDVKPENVLLDANGNAKLVDFGLAAMQKDTNEIWGTPYYIAPEKVKKEPVDYRADMYSLGGTIYHALTGVAPFEGEDAAAVVRKRFEDTPVPPSTIRPDISPQIDALVLKMLALNPADRFPSFEALLQEFGRVMATGLTASAAGPQTTTGTSVGGRKIMMKGRKRFKVKTSSEGEEGGGEQQPTRSAPPPEPEEGGVAGKVLAVIGITIAAIGLVAGLLVWYVIADKNAREKAKQEQIASNISRARDAIADVRKNAELFAEHCDDLAAKSLKTCQEPTDKLMKELSGKFDAALLAGLKPGPTPELLAAIALTNVVEKTTEGDTNALAAAAAPLAQALAGAMQEMATAVAAAVADIPKFRPPNDDEADPASPEHEAYIKAKEAWEKEQKEKMAQAAEAQKKAAEAAATPAAATPTASAPVSTDLNTVEGVKAAFEIQLREILSVAKRDTGIIWERAYGCQAASIRIRHKINGLIEKIDSFKVEGADEAAMQQLASFSQAAKDEFDQIKASDDVTAIQKGVSFIKSKGSNAVKQTVDRIFLATKEMERRLKQIEEHENTIKIQEEANRKKLETIAADNEKIKEKFDSLVTAGVFKQLDWKGATRQLTMVKDEFKYSESQIYADVFIQKVKMMATVQEVFIANCKDYKFAKSKLARFKIANITEKEISLIKPDGKTPMKMTWVKFYQQFHGNLNELIVKFIEKGKNVSKLADGKRLSLQPWADAMMGAALTMQIICGDDPTAPARAEQIAKNAVKELPDYLNRAKAVFPDMQFDAVPEE
ncbi:MAG: serine/threonine protein kinase [Kiritimatiellae bacterium]|nr:serine/threonine protein kinase [Kiritimatiellia bacterium]